MTSAERKDLNDMGSVFCFVFFLFLFPGDLEVAVGFILLSSCPLGICQDFLFRSSLECVPVLHTQSFFSWGLH